MLIKHSIHHIILFFILSINWLPLSAQSKSPNKISVNTSVNRTRILLGEQLELTLKIEVPSGKRLEQWPVIADSINHMEVVSRAALDSLVSANGVIYSQAFIMTSFDSGHWVIPPVSVMAAKKTYKSDSLGIDVGTVLLKGNDYNDIKEIIEVPRQGFNWKKWLPYIIGSLLLLLLLVYWWRNRKKAVPEEKPVSRSTAFEEAMTELKKLKAENLPEQGEMKQFYSRLYDIYRVYLGRFSGKKLMQSTTDDILISVKDLFPSDRFSKIAEVMRIADAVKFAKYPSSAEESAGSWENLHGSIQELNRQKV
jgi:BatD DUF11 like domain